MKINTTPGETYIVLSTGGCTAKTKEGKLIKTLAAGQDFFTAMTGDTVLSDDNASVTVAKGEILSLLNLNAPAAAAATIAEPEQESFTKLIFPPTGTATEEQDPSWVTKKNILMETSGGQLNMTHLAETLAYAAQTPLAVAKRTLWLSTSPGTGDAVQWPASTVFPADQAQDTVQQLNSNSTYCFDITYVGGIGKLLVRTICVWPTVMDTNEPTD